MAGTRIVAVVDEGLGNAAYLADLGDGRALAVDVPRDLRAQLDGGAGGRRAPGGGLHGWAHPGFAGHPAAGGVRDLAGLARPRSGHPPRHRREPPPGPR
ncbi:MAG TPA: hypothetical protein VMV92_36935 [Streptosporangiaceae bacterium]|nr:hypothetical protein [Streptosporangiaceae bacterium]